MSEQEEQAEHKEQAEAKSDYEVALAWKNYAETLAEDNKALAEANQQLAGAVRKRVDGMSELERSRLYEATMDYALGKAEIPTDPKEYEFQSYQVEAAREKSEEEAEKKKIQLGHLLIASRVSKHLAQTYIDHMEGPVQKLKEQEIDKRNEIERAATFEKFGEEKTNAMVKKVESHLEKIIGERAKEARTNLYESGILNNATFLEVMDKVVNKVEELEDRSGARPGVTYSHGADTKQSSSSSKPADYNDNEEYSRLLLSRDPADKAKLHEVITRRLEAAGFQSKQG